MFQTAPFQSTKQTRSLLAGQNTEQNKSLIRSNIYKQKDKRLKMEKLIQTPSISNPITQFPILVSNELLICKF